MCLHFFALRIGQKTQNQPDSRKNQVVGFSLINNRWTKKKFFQCLLNIVSIFHQVFLTQKTAYSNTILVLCAYLKFLLPCRCRDLLLHRKLQMRDLKSFDGGLKMKLNSTTNMFICRGKKDN